MQARIANLLSGVQGCQVWSSYDVESLLTAQQALLGGRVVGGPPVQDAPGDGVGRPPGFEVPDVGAQDSFVLVSLVIERFIVIAFPAFPVGGSTTHIGLLCLCAVRLGLDHLCLVHCVFVQAVALQWAGASLLHSLGAVTVPVLLLLLLLLLRLRHLGLALGQDLLVVAAYDLAHVGAGGIGDLEVAAVEHLPHWSVLREHLSIRARNLLPMFVFTFIE